MPSTHLNGRRLDAALLLFCMASALTACGQAHGKRISEINRFQAGYFNRLVATDYDEAYTSLHSDIQEIISADRYKAFIATLTETFGELKSWEKIPGSHDKRIPLLEPARYRDPLPPNKPKARLISQYILKFSSGKVTLTMTTVWENERLTIRGQILCMEPRCMDESVRKSLVANATALDVADLYGVKPPPKQTPPEAAPSEVATPEAVPAEKTTPEATPLEGAASEAAPSEVATPEAVPAEEATLEGTPLEGAASEVATPALEPSDEVPLEPQPPIMPSDNQHPTTE